jgi:hypothetical protein
VFSGASFETKFMILDAKPSCCFFVDVQPKTYVMTSLKYLRTPLERFGAVKKVTKD